MSTAQADQAKQEDQAVEDYLAWIKDPSSLVDEETVKRLEDELQACEDPIEELRIYTELTMAKDAPEDRYLQPFIEHAENWAKLHGIPAETFEWIGVQRKHLQAAGFVVKGRGGMRYSNRVPAESVIETLMTQKEGGLESFTKPEVRELVDSSPATITTAINRMIKDGIVARTDKDDPNHKGKGAKAIVFDFV